MEEKGTIKVNEPQVLVTGRASPGAKVRVYLNGSEQAESIADAQGRVSFVVEQLAPGENTVYIAELDQAGNESDPSDSLLVLYDAAAVIVGQITLSQREFAPPAEITIRFFVTDTRTLVVRATDGKKSVTIGELTDVSGLQTLNWSGMVDETPLPDGEYLIEIFEGTTKLAWTTVIISTAEPRKPLLLIPRNNGNLSSGKVRFSWEGSEAASFYRLRVWDGQTEFVYETYLTFFQLQDTLLPGVWNCKLKQ